MFKRAAAVFLAGMFVSSACWAKTYQVVVKDMEFSPAHIKISAGDTVEWINKDAVDHSVTAKDKSVDVEIAAHATQHFTFQQAGKLSYFCRYHPNMVGNVDVLAGNH